VTFHAAGTLFVLLFFTPLLTALSLSILDAFIHYHIDWAKIKLTATLTLNPPVDQVFGLLLDWVSTFTR